MWVTRSLSGLGSHKTTHSALGDEVLAAARARQKDPTAAGVEPARVTPIDFESIALTARPSCLDNPPQSPTRTHALAHSYAHGTHKTRTHHTPAPPTPRTASRSGDHTHGDVLHTVVRSQCTLPRILSCACTPTPSLLFRAPHACTSLLATTAMHVQCVLETMLHLHGHSVVCVAQVTMSGPLVGHRVIEWQVGH